MDAHVDLFAQLQEAQCYLDVPEEAHIAVLSLKAHIQRYPFRGFFVHSLPSYLQHDFVSTPVERVIIPERTPVVSRSDKLRWHARDRVVEIQKMHGQVVMLPPMLVDRAARFHRAFSRMLAGGRKVLPALRDVMSLVQRAHCEDPTTGMDALTLVRIPQVLLVLKRGILQLLDPKISADGIWSEQQDVDVTSLRKQVTLAPATTEPGVVEFANTALDFIAAVESLHIAY